LYGRLQQSISDLCTPSRTRNPARTECVVRQRCRGADASKTIRDNSVQMDTVGCGPRLPQVVSLRTRVRIAQLVVVFSAPAVACVRPAEAEQPCNADSRALRIIRAKRYTASNCSTCLSESESALKVVEFFHHFAVTLAGFGTSSTVPTLVFYVYWTELWHEGLAEHVLIEENAGGQRRTWTPRAPGKWVSTISNAAVLLIATQ
jgi:hypothetical protein